jgi:hypothetical protein
VVDVGDWPWCNPNGGPHERTRSRPITVHERERSVVYFNPKTGKAVYPPRNDQPIQDRYKKEGFERREFESLRALETFEKEAGVRSEAAWYDRGTGRGFDDRDMPALPSDVRNMIRDGVIGAHRRER